MQAQRDSEAGREAIEPGFDGQDYARTQDRLQPHLRLAAAGLTAIVAFFIAVGLVLHFKPGGDKPSGDVPELDLFAAGPVDDFDLGSITYFQNEHVYLVRFDDGAFLALYDLGADEQAKIEAGGQAKQACRVKLSQGEAMSSLLTDSRDNRGIDDRGFTDTCSGSVWSPQGTPLSGTNPALDRFPVAIVNDIVRVDLGARRCSQAGCIATQ